MITLMAFASEYRTNCYQNVGKQPQSQIRHGSTMSILHINHRKAPSAAGQGRSNWSPLKLKYSAFRSDKHATFGANSPEDSWDTANCIRVNLSTCYKQPLCKFHRKV